MKKLVITSWALATTNSSISHGKLNIKWYSKEVNEAIYSQPYIKPKFIGEILGITSRTTLTKYFNELFTNQVNNTCSTTGHSCPEIQIFLITLR